MKLTIEDIQRCFWVDDTGTVRWQASVEPVGNNHLHWFNGTVAGMLTKPTASGVQYRRIEYKQLDKRCTVPAHVIAYVLHNGRFPKGDIDHVDGNGLNNRGANLRDVSKRVNLCNAKLYANNMSGVKGVTPIKRCPGMWRADATVNGKPHNLYYGDDFFLAVCARKSFEAKHDHDSAYSSQGNSRGLTNYASK